METVLIVVFIAVIVAMVIYTINKGMLNPGGHVGTTLPQNNIMIDDAQRFCDDVYHNKKLPEIQVSLNLKKGEKAHFQDSSVVLYEERSKSVSNRGGGAVRVAKGLYVGTSQSISRSYSELREIDRGVLIFTNKRVIFSGSLKLKEFQLDKIIQIDLKSDGFSVAYAGKEKKPLFEIRTNPLIWQVMIGIQRKIDNGEEIPHFSLNVEVV